MIPFGLKNAPTIFSQVVVTAFKDFIQKFIKVYMDDWTVYGLIRDHLENLWSLNLWYKEKVKVELDRMLDAGIIEPLEESEWISPMVV